MIVDSSALVAIALGESDSDRLRMAIRQAAAPRWSVVSSVEAHIVLGSRLSGADANRARQLISGLGLVLEPVTVAQAQLAREAYDRFGKGRHPARLNLGDCFSYALAKATGEPLLFKGDDFALTDVAAVTY